MNRAKKIILLLIAVIFALPGNAFSGDESVLFTSVPPDALIVLDLSGSMDWNPAGGSYIYGASTSCVSNTTACSGTGCSGGYCNASKPGCAVNCSRLAIAKRAIFAMLDDTGDNVITSEGTNSDDNSLNIRIGYMSFCGGNDTAGNYNAGNIRLRQPIGTKYSQIFCGNTTSCSLTISDSGSCTEFVFNTQAYSGTPLASSLIEAKSYLDWHKNQDNAKACRDKFVILITDGADTYACGGTGTEDAADMYKRRRETVARAKALGDAGYKVFVIGFGGDMPLALKRTLNLAAYYGGTDNPIEPNSGSIAGYDIPTGSLYPAGVTECAVAASTSIIHNIAGKNGGIGDTVANTNDPATVDLSGYAFITADATELTAALKIATNIIRSARYSFTIASVSTARIATENHLYEASLTPVEDEPFWLGHLKKYNILSDGNIGPQVWDAGTVLAGTAASGRNIKTCLSGTTLTNFNTSLTPLNLGVSTTTRRDEIVGYIRGEAAYNQENWKLGDIWHSSPVVISTPNPFFDDKRDANDAFEIFRTANLRTSENGKRVVLAGANDGQLHVFRTNDGTETFSFIPPNMLPKLQLIDHKTHPTSKQHQFFVDGPITVTNVWLGTGDGTSKSASEWRTMVVFGLGRGVGPNSQYLWSASPNCTPTSSTPPYGYSNTYHATDFPYYCGYYAFDFTDTLAPQYKWRLNPSASDAPYLGEPWSKMAIGRVKIAGNEKWVGFMGGGGCDYDCSTRTCTGTKGKGFFVINLSNGNVLWSHTGINYAIPAHPVIVDIDNDGFIDTAYVGDLGGNIWRFKFCTINDPISCNDSNWSASLLYNGGGERFYTAVTVAKDPQKNVWVYWGTGDKQCPALTTGATGRFYALKDGDAYKPLLNPTYSPTTYSIAEDGWSISLSGLGEKILGEPTVYAGEVFFTSYIPWVEGGDPCKRGGQGKLYVVNYLTGALIGSVNLGIGIPSAPLLSISPDKTRVDLYITMSGGGGEGSRTYKPSLPPDSKLSNGNNGNGVLPRTNILFWKDRRVK